MISEKPEEIGQFLEWDSEFFGKRIARVNASTLTPHTAQELIEWAAANRIDCVYFLASADDNLTTVCAEKNHFHLVDLRVTLTANLVGRQINPSPDPCIRLANESDVGELRRIAGLNHTNSRFFTDEHFDKEKCRELYEVWIEKSVKGMADRVFVWDDNGRAVGYVTTIKTEEGIGSISLVGISPDFQGKGIGKKLIAAALDYFVSRDLVSAKTVTQGRNTRALTLYQKNGFIAHSIELWYHKWFTE